jgi:hypothetical protein
LLRLEQPARHRLRHEISGAHVEPHDDVEILDADIHQRLRAIGAGIVDEDIERRCLADRRLHGGEVGDVERERLGLMSAGADGRGGGLDLILGARRQRHLRPGLGER